MIATGVENDARYRVALGVFDGDGGTVTVAVNDRLINLKFVEQLPKVRDVASKGLRRSGRRVSVPREGIGYQFVFPFEGSQLGIRVPERAKATVDKHDSRIWTGQMQRL